MNKLVLASSSKFRVSLLSQIGYSPDIIRPANIDETPHKGEKGNKLALRLAREKAIEVSKIYQEYVVLGSDTVTTVKGRILPKAMTEEDAKFCLNLLSGRRAKIYTGVACVLKNEVRTRLVESTIKFKVLTQKEKDFYIETKEWYEKAGGYGVQGVAASFIIWSSGGFTTNIVGLPTYETYSLLSSFNIFPNLNNLK